MSENLAATDVFACVEINEFERQYLISAGTLIQCLQIAVQEHRLPPLDELWLAIAIPDKLRIPEKHAGSPTGR